MWTQTEKLECSQIKLDSYVCRHSWLTHTLDAKTMMELTAKKVQYWAISLQLSCSVTMTPSPSVSPTILAARLATRTYKMLAWSEESCFYFHPIECWVGVSLTWGTHSIRVHYGKKQRLGPPSTVCGSYFDTTYIRIVAAHVHPFWKWHPFTKQ